MIVKSMLTCAYPMTFLPFYVWVLPIELSLESAEARFNCSTTKPTGYASPHSGPSPFQERVHPKAGFHPAPVHSLDTLAVNSLGASLRGLDNLPPDIPGRADMMSVNPLELIK
jgi:hypothetical protein